MRRRCVAGAAAAAALRCARPAARWRRAYSAAADADAARLQGDRALDARPRPADAAAARRLVDAVSAIRR